MSSGNSKKEDFNSKNLSKAEVDQNVVQSKNSNNKPLVFNVFGGNFPELSDKNTLTQTSVSRSFIISQTPKLPGEIQKREAPNTSRNYNFENHRREAPKSLINYNFESKQEKVAETPSREKNNLMSNDRKDDRSTENRKPYPSDPKNYKKMRLLPDVERMKLQAELKATEEIANLKQTIIEKRLELELATIQNKVDYPSDSRSSYAEIRALDDLMKKKQTAIEANLAQELKKIDSQFRAQSTRRPPSPPSPVQRPSPPSSPVRSLNPFKTDQNRMESSSSMMRGLSYLDKKFAAEKLYPPKPIPKNIFESRFAEERPKQADWYRKFYREQQSEYDRQPPERRSQSAWKSAVAKIKKKMKNKSDPPWG